MSEVSESYLSSREAASLLGVAVSTVQLWTNNGLLRAWTTGGGHRRILRSSVEEMLKGKEPDSCVENAEPLKIVVVDDNEQQLRLYKKQISRWNSCIQIFAAPDGYEGLIKIGRELPDIIITDLLMPYMDGFEMIRALSNNPDLVHSQIVVVSGLSRDEVNKKGGLPSGVELLQKPVVFDGLQKILSKFEQIEIGSS